jgi:urease accessory protein
MIQTWLATLELRVEARGSCSLLAHSRHHGPLRVQRVFYPEGPSVCHMYLLHPPGGVVPGDQLDFDVGVGTGAGALVTTPAASKIYRSDGRRAAQRSRLSVASGAALEWLPQETIVFDGARVDLETTVLLDEGAVFVGWEVQCLGRPAIAERFTTGQCRSRLEIVRAGLPLFVERAVYDGGSDVLRGGYGLAGQCAFGTMVAVAREPAALDVVRAVLPEPSAGELLSATRLGGGDVLCCRYLGSSASRGRQRFNQIWSALRPHLLGRAATYPRIWAT